MTPRFISDLGLLGLVYQPAIRQWLAPLVVLGLAACAHNEIPPGSEVADKLSHITFDPPASVESKIEAQELGEPKVENKDGKQIYLGKEQATAGARAQKSSGGVEINFENAEINEVVRVILGEVLGLTYSIDASIAGTVTIDSGGPLSDDQLISVLESVLAMSGAVLVGDGAGYKIVPSETAHGPAELLDLAAETTDVAPGFGSTIIPLRFIAASTAAQFARPLVHRADDIQFDDRLNLLLIVGSTAERQNVVDTIRDLDVDWLAGKSVGIFPLAVTTPEAMIPELEALFDATDEQSELTAAANIQFIAMARLNAILAIANNPEQVVQADRWISRLDRGKSVGLQFYVYTLKHLPAVEVADLLTESFGGIGGANRTNRQEANRVLDPIAFERDQLGFGDRQFGSNDIETDIAPLEPPAPNEPSTIASDVVASGASLAGDVKIVANKTNNSLLIRASSQSYEAIEATLRRLDRAPLQVLIEATIIEVTLNDQLRYGVQYFLESGSFQAGFDNTNASASAAANLINPLTQLPGFNFLFTPGSSRLLIDALSSLTDVRVLSSPTLVVQDNNSATLTVGDDVPVTTRTAVGVVDADAPVVNNIEYRATGVTLQVAPRINSNEVVSLKVIQEVSRLSNPTDPGLTPIITQRRIDSSVNVQTGQTIVLGGLIQDTETRERNQLPILGDVPILGSLFGGTDNRAQRTELIVLIKPRIIRSAEDARDVSEELRARMRSFSPVRAKSRFQPWQKSSNVEENLQEPPQVNETALSGGQIQQSSGGRIDGDHAAPKNVPQPALVVSDRQSVARSHAISEAGSAPVKRIDPLARPLLFPQLRPIAGDIPAPRPRPFELL